MFYRNERGHPDIVTPKAITDIAEFIYGLVYIVFWQYGIRAGIFIYFFSFLASWGIALHCEPETNKAFTEFANFWYYHFVTASTIGYGDIVPKSAFCKFALPPFILTIGGSGLLTISASIVKLIKKVYQFGALGEIKIMKKNHIVVISKSYGQANAILGILLKNEQLQAEKRGFVACTKEQAMLISDSRLSGIELDDKENPNDIVEHVGITRAHAVIVDLDDDAEAVCMCLAVQNKIKARDVNIVVVLQQMDNAVNIANISKKIICIPQGNPGSIATAAILPRRARYNEDLSMPGGRVNAYEMICNHVEDGITIADLNDYLFRTFHARVTYAVLSEFYIINPGPQKIIADGDIIGYDGPQFINPADIAWDEIKKQ